MKNKKQIPFEKSRTKIIKWALFLTTIALLLLYGFSDQSKVASIIVEGTHYLEDTYIQDVANIHQNDFYYLNIPFLKEMKLKQDPMIQDAKVTLINDNVIKITIQEKKAIGYRYEDDPQILLSDNTTASLKSEYLNIIASVPLITGFSDAEQTRLLCKAFEDVDVETIESISEIEQYALSYDDEAIRIRMINGGYFIGNYQNLDKLNAYYTIYSNMKDKSQCISADENANVAYTYVCPWNEDSGNTEYWTDENGNILENAYGDKIVKHYYTDESGNQAVDANGNAIAIPIDENGSEVIDPNFNRNYSEGYYATGVLELPEGVSNEPIATPTPDINTEDMPE